MPYQTHGSVDPNQLRNTRYGFFTNEKGSSAGGYVVSYERECDSTTRNVNLYSPQEKEQAGYDPAGTVVDNLMACFSELTNNQENDSHTHKFVMTSNYGAGGACVLTCQSKEELEALKRQSSREAPGLKLHHDFQEKLAEKNVYPLKADGLVFKGVPGELVVAGGASGDAHPIVLMDDEKKVCAYIAGAHAALKAGVIEKTIAQMIAAGATRQNIQLVIGPGLGKQSYEFGPMKEATPDVYLNVPKDKVTQVSDDKWLLDIETLVKFKAMGLMPENQIHNMDIDTMGFDLYDENQVRRTSVDFDSLHKQGLLFFGARRSIMEESGLTAQSPGLHNTVGRHFAGMVVKG